MPYSPLVEIFMAFASSLSDSLLKCHTARSRRHEIRQAGQVAEVAGAASPGEVERLHADRLRPLDILQPAVAHVQDLAGGRAQPAQRSLEDAAVRLLGPHLG